MKISSDKLKARVKGAGLSAEQLGEAVARPGLPRSASASAVRNWMSGRDHPRCKPQDVQRLADALGCERKDLVTYRCESRFVRSSPRKSGLIVEMIRGKSYAEAESLLTFTSRRAAVFVLKALKAAHKQAEDGGADTSALSVCEARVSQGPIIKRFQPKDRGRAHAIEKITSHIVVAVEERA